MRRAIMDICTVLGFLALAGCAATTTEAPRQPAFYDNLARAEAHVNVNAAASLLSDYRQKNGLPRVEIDQRLVEMAEAQAKDMARRNQLTHDPGGRNFNKRLTASGFNAQRAAENIGAGYHTLAEAFTGWRDSPSHNKNMLLTGATKMGIAAAYAPNSKYKVFWALVLAEPDK
jgi:uncharacterized protein YkwD